MNPNLFSSGGVEGNQRTILRQHVHHVVNDDGIEQISVVVAGRINPRNLELIYIGFVDLVECDVVGRIGTASVIRPFPVILLRCCEGSCQRDQKGRQGELAIGRKDRQDFSLRDDLLRHNPSDIGQSKIPAGIVIRETRVI